MKVEEPAPGPKLGCVTAGTAWLLLVALAPFAALVRWWRRLRRGAAPRAGWAVEGGRPLSIIDLTVDVPSAMTSRARHVLVDVIVRIAEELRRSDDLYNLVWKEAGAGETTLVAVGPRPQALAQHLDTALSHRGFERRTQLWLTLPRDVYLAELVDPIVFDPEVEEAPAGLLGRSAPRWAMEVSFARGSPSTVYRLRLHVPAGTTDVVEQHLSRLRDRLGEKRA